MATKKHSVIRYVIVGGGPAGVHAAVTIRSHDPNASIVLLHGEPDLPYHRMELDSVIGGSFSAEQLPLHSKTWYHDQAIDIQLNSQAVRLSPATNHIALQTGAQLEYDALLLATGARPLMGGWPGHHLNGVMTLRTWQDAQRILASVKTSRTSVIIVGGGLLGLTLAENLRPYVKKLMVIEQAQQMWNPVFDQKSSELIRNEAGRRGVEILLNEQVKELKGDAAGVKEVCTSKSQTFEAKVVVVAIGVYPTIDFLEGSGLRVDRGVLIDHEFRTNVDNIYAAGDVAQAYDPELGRFHVVTNWRNAVEQGQLAGAAMTGQSILYQGVMPAHSETLFGIPVMMRGRLSVKGNNSSIFIGENTEKGIYRKIVLKAGKIIGALFLGNNTGAGMIQHYIREKKSMDLSEVKSTFLTGLVIGEERRA